MLSGKSNNDAKNLAAHIKKFLETEIIPKISASITNCVCDVYVKGDNSIHVIELNSFGYWQAAGSALFHWIHDKAKLYGEKECTYIRFIK